MRGSWLRGFWESLSDFARMLWQEVFPPAPETPHRDEEGDETAGL